MVIIVKDSLNIPIADDFDVYLRPIITYKENSSFNGIFSALFEQHVNHRLFIPRLINLISFLFVGKVNFIVLIIIGNLFLLGCIPVIYSFFTKYDQRGILLFFITIFLVHYFDQENKLWATGSIQNYGVLFFTLFSLKFTTSMRVGHVISSYVFALLALLTSANGLFLFAIIPLIHLIYHKKFWSFLIGTMVFLFATKLYYYQFYYGEGVTDPMINIRYRLYDIGLYFFTFYANPSWQNFKLIVVSQILGVVIFGFTVFTIIKYYRTHLALCGVLVFIMLSAGAAAATRVQYGVEQAMSNRYCIFTVLNIGILVLVLIANMETTKHYFRRIILLLALVTIISFPVYRNNVKGNYRKSNMYKDVVYCYKLDLNRLTIIYPRKEFALNYLNESKEKGIYYLPEYKNRVCK